MWGERQRFNRARCGSRTAAGARFRERIDWRSEPRDDPMKRFGTNSGRVCSGVARSETLQAMRSRLECPHLFRWGEGRDNDGPSTAPTRGGAANRSDRNGPSCVSKNHLSKRQKTIIIIIIIKVTLTHTHTHAHTRIYRHAHTTTPREILTIRFVLPDLFGTEIDLTKLSFRTGEGRRRRNQRKGWQDECVAWKGERWTLSLSCVWALLVEWSLLAFPSLYFAFIEFS